MYSGNNQRDENGEAIIPASQRPDGTWRKARRVKEGYVPQEEVPLYESKGKQFLNRQMQPAEPLKVEGFTTHRSIPGLFIQEVKEKPVKTKKKTKKVEDITKQVEQLKLTEPIQPIQQKTKVANTTKSKGDASSDVDPAKKLKYLKKRLREVETLETKIKNGEIAKPDAEQLAKIQRKNDVIIQIKDLEKEIN